MNCYEKYFHVCCNLENITDSLYFFFKLKVKKKIILLRYVLKKKKKINKRKRKKIRKNQYLTCYETNINTVESFILIGRYENSDNKTITYFIFHFKKIH